MPAIVKLLEDLPEISQSRLVASGYGVWLVWNGELHSSVENTMREYGALCVSRKEGQALWYCNTVEIFRAMARLQVWARLNPMSLYCQLFPLTFLAGYDLEYTVSLSVELDRQDLLATEDFELLVHPKLKDAIKTVPGLSVEPAGGTGAAANVEWQHLIVDQSLDYETLRKWYFIIKPLGPPADKEAIIGWRDFSKEITELIQRLGLKYISDVEEGAIFFPLDNFRMLRSFTTEMMRLISQVKDDEEKRYWPVVMVATPQGDLSFTADLPRKVGLDWNRLTPDFPHVRFMDGFLLSEWFRMNEVRFGLDQISLDSWCTLSLKEGGEDVGYGTMQVALPSALVSSEGRECFYCGLKNHEPQQCPTKTIKELQPHVWQHLSRTNINDFSDGFSSLDDVLDATNFAPSVRRLMEGKEDLKSALAKAVFEINSPVQLRMLSLVWRSRGKEWADGFKQLTAEEGDYIWDALRALEDGELEEAEGLLKEAQLKYPRSYQPHSLWGFWYMEMGDTNQALFQWQEAERMSYTPLQQGLLAMLQARLMEVDGNLKESINIYKHANTLAPSWLEPVYRQAVCLVKMGFSGQAMDLFADLIHRDPNVFNRVLIDPELDRGRVQLMNALWDHWREAEESAEVMRSKVAELTDDITKRFDDSHNYFETANEELERLRQLGTTSNYVAYQLLLRGGDRFEDNLSREVKREVKRIKGNIDYLTEQVRQVRKEAAWFPFPKLLIDFNKEFNACVDKINWIKTQQLNDADNFRKSLRFVDEIEGHIESLQRRLVTLRIIRDSTLFTLMLGKSFIWLELIGLGLLLIGLPSLIYFTQGVHGNYIIDIINDPSQRWEISKGLVIVVSVLAVVFAAVKSALSFDKRKRELFDQIDDEARAAAPKRY